MGKDVGSQVSKFTPSYHSSSPPSSHPLDYCGRGFCDPHHPSPRLTARMQSETPPRRLYFGFFAQTSSPRLALSTRPPHHHHHSCTTPPPLPVIPHCRFTQRARNRTATARVRIFAPTLSPRLALLIRQPHHHQLHHCTTPPLFPTIFHYCFTRRT